MPRPFFDAFRLPGDARAVGQPADALERWLRDLAQILKPDGGISHFFFEAQHIDGKINIDTVYRLIALGGIVEKFAYQTGALAYKVDISTWRKHFIGKGSGHKARGENPKELAIQRCAEYGWHTDIHDAAEACGILDYALSLIPNYHRPWRDNTLMGGAR